MSARNKRNQENRLNAFDEKTNLEQVADEIFGASESPEFNTGRVVARPIPIEQIWADVRQPRRVIPASIRLVWNGSPADVPQLLQTWASVAANAAGQTIDIQAIINGKGEGVDTDGTPAVYESFISLLRLAGSILREGLMNPITIVDQRDRHLIESGERRWLAYWLLRLYTQAGDEFARIPATIASGTDFVWRQAAENTARRSLNAVGMARQLALLIMAARGADAYHDYEHIVPSGASDRRYYAQIADGNIHRIPKGAGERIQAAMGLAKEQLSRYRDLLRITDDEEINDLLWLQGDIEDWPESAFRDANRLPIGNLRTILSRDAWSYTDFRPDTLTGVKVQPPAPPPAYPPAPQPFTPVGAQRAAPSSPPPTQSYQGAEVEEARRILANIREGFNRVYAIEDSPNPAEQLAANPPPSTSGKLEGITEFAVKAILKWAWRYGMGNLNVGGWFTRQDSQFESGDLALLVLHGFLQQATHMGHVRYRIVPLGCSLLGAGFEVIDWDAREQAIANPPAPPPASDNVPSGAPDNQPIMDRAAPIYTLLQGLKTLAQSTEYLDAVDTVELLSDMTWGTARQLKTTGQLDDVLQLHYDNIIAALSAWSTTLSEFLEDLNTKLAD